jgi:hypothetical protein
LSTAALAHAAPAALSVTSCPVTALDYAASHPKGALALVLDRLSLRQRKILCAYLDSRDGCLKSPLLAAELGVSPSSIRVEHARALAKAKVLLEELGYSS